MTATESKPTDRRRQNRGTKGNRGGGRPVKRKTLVIDGIIQDGHYRLVAVTGDTLVLESVSAEN